MPTVGLRLPSWTRRPVFGVVLLFALAIALIAHGEPQPSSRPSGRSVVVSSATPVDVPVPATLIITGATVQRRVGSQVQRVPLPAGVTPVSVITSGDYSVVLGVSGGRQRAYGVTAALKVTDLGFADAVAPAATAPAVVVIEQAVLDPGRVVPPQSSLTPSPSLSPTSAGALAPTTAQPTGSSRTATRTSARPTTATPASGLAGSSLSTGASASSSSTTGEPAPARDYTVRRYDALGHQVGPAVDLPEQEQLATDSAVGLVAWKPVSLVVDRGQVTEALSATASLVRPDGSIRVIGPFHPLAADGQDLLVWDVAHGAFGLVPLAEATASSTRTATPTVSKSATPSLTPTAAASGHSSASRTRPAVRPSSTPSARDRSDTASASSSTSPSASPSASASPTSVAGARFFQPTRGFIVTGPSSFSPDGASFAAYAVVGNRRRLVIGDVSQVGTDQIAVLALSQAEAEPHASGSLSTGGVAGVSISGTVTAAGPGPTLPASGSARPATSGSTSGAQATPSASPSPSVPAFEPDGFPVPAPAAPVWLSATLVAGVAADGTVVGYVPGGNSASVLDLGTPDVLSLANAP